MAWRHMKDRCLNPKHKQWKFYGGRGVTICDRWKTSFANFLADAGKRPSVNHSIDRFPDKDGNYEPGNIRWATDMEQNRNRRNNVLLTFGGRTMCVAAWEQELGMSTRLVSDRLRQGWSVERALTEPKRR
jgi:hypothetical protein